MNGLHKSLRYDQGFFNTARLLVREIVDRNHLHFLCELDASGMDTVRAAVRTAGGQTPTYTAFVVKAVGLALKEHPHLNVMVQERPWNTRLVPLKNMTATVAVERNVDGVDMVFAPMVQDSGERNLGDLTSQLRHFAEAEPNEISEFVRFQQLVRWARWVPSLVGLLFRIPALSPGLWARFRGGAYAVTSPGKYGGCDQVLPPWPWPFTFSFGAVKFRPWVVGDQVVPRRTMRLTITVDRRIANGAPIARFAERLRELLERPECWASPGKAPVASPERVLDVQSAGLPVVAQTSV